MPRAGGGTGAYSLPAIYLAIPGTTILSVQHNTPLEDIANTFNQLYPVGYGGTGAGTAVGGADNLSTSASIASSGTTDLGNVAGVNVTITGTTTITSLGSAPIGAKRWVTFAGILTLTYNATSLILPGGVNITTAAGDTAVFASEGAGNWRCVSYMRSDGTSLSVGGANIGLAASVAANALTISLVGANGAVPSASNVVNVTFRDVTSATGTPVTLHVTAANTLVISSGSTMGFTSAVTGRLWIVGFNDAGTFRLGAVNCLSGINIMALRDGIYSSTAEGGAGAADSAQVIYTSTAVTSKALTILGYLEATEATAGTWATAPSLVQLFTPGTSLPGTVVAIARTDLGTVATGTTTIPVDNTIPQITEGDQYLSQALTPSKAGNLLRISAQALVSIPTINANITMAIFRDATANALAATAISENAAGNPWMIAANIATLAAAAVSTTFRVRIGGTSGSTLTVNGTGGAQVLGGVANTFLQIEEIMA